MLYKLNTDKPLSSLDYTIAEVEKIAKDLLLTRERPVIHDVSNITDAHKLKKY